MAIFFKNISIINNCINVDGNFLIFFVFNNCINFIGIFLIFMLFNYCI